MIKCAYVWFLILLKIRALNEAKIQAEIIFLLLIEDEIK